MKGLKARRGMKVERSGNRFKSLSLQRRGRSYNEGFKGASFLENVSVLHFDSFLFVFVA